MANTTSTVPVGYDLTSSSTENVTNSSVMSRDEGIVRAEVAVQAVLFILAVGGNSLVLVILLAIRRRKLNRMNMMIAHLSVADLSVAFFTTLPQLIWDITGAFQGNDFLCRLITMLQLTAMFASSYVMVTTTIDRFLVICYPLSLHQWTRKRILVLVGIAWILAVFFAIPQIFIFSYQDVNGIHTCYAHFSPQWTEKLYVTYIFLAIYVIPLILISGAYISICLTVWNSTKMKFVSSRPARSNRSPGIDANNGLLRVSSSDGAAQNAGCNSRAHVGGRMAKAKMKTILMTLTVIICYIVCWGPFFVAQLWSVYDINAPFQGTTMVIIVLLPSLNSCANPWIYMAFMNSPIQRLKQFCTRQKPRRSSTLIGDSDARMRISTFISNTEFTRMDATAEKR